MTLTDTLFMSQVLFLKKFDLMIREELEKIRRTGQENAVLKNSRPKAKKSSHKEKEEE